MKSIWSIISILALANLLALTGFVGWLGSSGRLSKERVEAVRTIFVPTVAQEAAQREEAAHLAEADAAAKIQEARLAAPPVPASDRIRDKQEQAEVALQNRQRLDSDIKALQSFLVRESERLKSWETELKAKETAFEVEQQRVRETAGSDQFRKALATLAGIKPKEAQAILAEMLAQNKHDDVVSFLDAMEERARSRVLAEFNKADPKVAADLLERLRTRGIASAMPVGSGEPTN